MLWHHHHDAQHGSHLRQGVLRRSRLGLQATLGLLRLRYVICIASVSVFGMCLLAINHIDYELASFVKTKYLRPSVIGGARLIPVPGAPNVKLPIDETTSASYDRVAVIVICYNRPDYLRRTLSSVSSLWPSAGTISDVNFSLIIAQDGYDSGVTSVVEKFQESFHSAGHINFSYDPSVWQSKYTEPFIENLAVYYRISAHYQFILSNVLKNNPGYSHILFVEDDFLLAPDFFHYFAAATRYLTKYKSVFCASAWNDNGQERFVNDPGALYRTDIFPGLGWMITRDVALEIFSKWPAGFWDDWLREPQQRKGRSCVFPEINRVTTFGSEGSSKGEWFDQYLATIRLNTAFVDWTNQSETMTSVFDKTIFDEALWRQVNSSIRISMEGLSDLLSSEQPTGNSQSFRLDYSSESEFEVIAASIKCMPDWKSGLPRASYQGVSIFNMRNFRLFLVKNVYKSTVERI